MTGGAFALVRAAHEFGALLAFGSVVYATAIGRAFDRRARIGAAACLAASLVAALGWLAFEAANMSGLPFSDALTPSIVGVVLEATLFGRVWTLRLVLGTALCVWLLLRQHASDGRGPRGAPAGGGVEAWTTLALAAIYTATLALTGHAVAAEGVQRAVHVAADAGHLLAAGTWLGSLPGLATSLSAAKRSGTPASIAAASRTTARFSILGIASVGVLIATGIVNAWFLVGSRLALVGTPYGQWLLAKLAIFATMVAIAAYNRERLAPRIANGDRSALGTLARNARIELGLGAVVVAIVGHLGLLPPAAHDRVHVPAFLAPGDAAAVYPTGNAVSPVRATDDVVRRGRELYLGRCASCHGDSGHGDGPAAASLRIHPLDLVAHGSMHTQGDLWWMIAHGIPGSPMPAFSPDLRGEEIWELVEYVRVLAGLRDAPPSVVPPSVVPRPDKPPSDKPPSDASPVRAHALTH